jgi:hypothetical protein
MITANELADALARNEGNVKNQTNGMSQEDSLLQLPFRGNWLNRVVGHVVANWDTMIALLGEPPQIGDSGTRYRRKSDPIQFPAKRSFR